MCVCSTYARQCLQMLSHAFHLFLFLFLSLFWSHLTHIFFIMCSKIITSAHPNQATGNVHQGTSSASFFKHYSHSFILYLFPVPLLTYPTSSHLQKARLLEAVNKPSSIHGENECFLISLSSLTFWEKRGRKHCIFRGAFAHSINPWKYCTWSI